MIKKIILVCMLAAASSFATWDLFPVLENHKGQAKLGAAYKTYEVKHRDYDLFFVNAGVRYTVIQDLELALTIPYRALVYVDGENIGEERLGNLQFSTRYQFIPVMNVFADIGIPVRDIDDDAWDLNFGLQFSSRINQLINFGSELAATFIVVPDYDDVPIDLYGGACLRFAVTPQFTPYVGTLFTLTLGGYSDNGYQYSHGGGHVALGPYIGAIYDFNDFVSLDAWAQISRYVNVDNATLFVTTGLSVLVNF
ncbi:MAG: hypothetical protein J6U20_11930 [Fibrobacter sp.]|nr:hypothetical protein [Fibrobacter sp.]